MQSTPLKQQLLNYSVLFKQLFLDYYLHQKKLFWLIQLLMVVSTLTGLFWILSIVLGVSHYQNPTQVSGFKYLLFAWVFKLPLWQWLILATVAGIISAWTLFLSIQVGVKSVLEFQKYLSQKCLQLVADDKYDHWTQEFEQMPRLVLLRILRQGVQLCGLVARRITRAFVSLITFVMAFFVLLYLDAKLLLILMPFSIIYIVALYFINRYAARVSTEMADTLALSSSRFGQLISRILNRKLNIKSDEFHQQFDDSLYMYQAELKYKRRLAEIHVLWLNTLFLVIGIALIIVYIVYIQASLKIDWQNLLFFLIALKYAASALQQISATTVAFSRFIPEIQLVYRLLNVTNLTSNQQRLTVEKHAIVFICSNSIDDFEIKQLNNTLAFNISHEIKLFQDIRESGINKFFKKLVEQDVQNIIVDNNLERLKRIIANHKDKISAVVDGVLVFSSNYADLKQISFEEFQQFTLQNNDFDVDDDIDAFV